MIELTFTEMRKDAVVGTVLEVEIKSSVWDTSYLKCLLESRYKY